jgi:phage recombination protein Bet
MTALAKIEPMHTQTMVFDNSQINLLKTTICKGASDDELKFFIYACQRTGLDPFARQIYSVPRGGQRVIQTSVDGFRLIADRSGKYAPGREPTYTYDVHGNLVSATAYVKKQTRDGTWHEVSANARFDEYDGKNTFWKTKSHIMLSKCAECLALRKAFPAEMSGLYGQDEMDQADVRQSYKDDKLSQSKVIELATLLAQCSVETKENFPKFLVKEYQVELLDDVPASAYERLKKFIDIRRKENQKTLVEKEMGTINVTPEDVK